jgi:hypothetical protein
MIINRVFRADLKRHHTDEEQHRMLMSRLRQASFLCSQFGNHCLTANYLLYRHKDAAEDGDKLLDALAMEQADAKGRYRDWADKLSSYSRDAIAKTVVGIIKARGKEVMRGECSLPSFHRRGAIRVRERGVRLWRDEDGFLWASLSVFPKEEPIAMRLWVKGLAGPYRETLERLIAGSAKITQGQVVIVDGYKVSLRFSYQEEVDESGSSLPAQLLITSTGLSLQAGPRTIPFGFDVLAAARRKEQIEGRRIQCWRLIRGQKLKRRRTRIYRSGTLSKISRAWTDYQRTWAQQLGSAVVKECAKWKVGALAIPTSAKMAESFVELLNWSLIEQSIRNSCDKAGIEVSQIKADSEQKDGLRTKAKRVRREPSSTTGIAERVQAGGTAADQPPGQRLQANMK